MSRLFFRLSDERKIITPVFWCQSYLGFYEIDNGTNLRLIYETKHKGITLKKLKNRQEFSRCANYKDGRGSCTIRYICNVVLAQKKAKSKKHRKSICTQKVICTPKVRHFWRCIFLWAKQEERKKSIVQNSK